MTHIRTLLLGAFLSASCLSLVLAAPVNAAPRDTATAQRDTHSTQANTRAGGVRLATTAVNSKKASQDKATKQAVTKDGKKHPSLAGNKHASLDGKKHGQKAAAKKKGKGRLTTKSDPAEKALWMQRARDGYAMQGKASLYGSFHHGGATASGVAYDMYTFTAAHRTLPMGTVVKVTDQENGRSVMVCITDRGPFIRGRIIDLSYAAAKQLDLNERGVGNVAVNVVSDEKGDILRENEAYYVRYSPKDSERAGPFKTFADAAALHEALRAAHPEAEVIVETTESDLRIPVNTEGIVESHSRGSDTLGPTD
ncbi:MAG: septal ring lytic transglycosylase RlpA family protein [Desulfovibrio sp.]|jgi:rare lipoprotein A (peptidoglycan hydrolase)|nr:septal ring lytic transglycosylase RlpA family protein [Desulfovibrio sp.]